MAIIVLIICLITIYFNMFNIIIINFINLIIIHYNFTIIISFINYHYSFDLITQFIVIKLIKVIQYFIDNFVH